MTSALPWGIWSVRTAGSVLGPAAAWQKGRDGEILRFATETEAHDEAKRINSRFTTPNVLPRGSSLRRP